MGGSFEPWTAAALVHGHTDTLAVVPARVVDPLICVLVVCRERPRIAGLLYVVLKIDAFLYHPQHRHKMLEDAVADDNLHLLRRLLLDATDRAPSSYQQRHPFYVGLQITKAARLAVKNHRTSSNLELIMKSLHAVNPEAVGASEVVDEAAAAGDLELIKWLHANCPLDPESVDSSQAAARAGGNGHVHVLEWLCVHRWSLQSRFSLDSVAKNSQHEVLRWLDDRSADTPSQHPAVSIDIGSGAIRGAAGNGDLEMLEWLFGHRQDESATYAGDSAAANGHVHILEWFYEFHQEDAQCYWEGYTAAAYNGHIEVLQWLYSHYPMRHWTKSMEAAAESGQLEVVALLHEQGNEGALIGYSASFAASGGHFEVLKYLFELYPTQCGRVVHAAAGSGNLEMVKWLHESHKQKIVSASVIKSAVYHGRVSVLEYIFPYLSGHGLTYTMCYAAQGDHMHVMEWIHARLVEPNSPWADTEVRVDRWRVTSGGAAAFPVNFAARNGNLEMVQWLNANGYGDCTTSAMDWAAGNGHLGVVRWLHENRTEGCTTDAMDKASENGKLEVVKWLHANRIEGCTTQAVNLAVRNGHARVVEFLLTNRSEGCTSAAAHTATVFRRDAELIHLLFEYCSDLVDLESVREHVEGNEGMRRWLHQVGSKLT